jgi:phenylacetate-CoA ligase
MCVLAYDKDCDNRYRPFATYGLAEVEKGHLIGTSFHNFEMPLIRYDTGDLVEATMVSRGGMVEEFAIKEGRSGDFIEDKNGKKIPLTALIFGRHHKAFDVADYIQIGQTEPGKATLYVTAKDGSGQRDLGKLFDLTNVDIDFEFKAVEKPVRTAMGKLKLRV